MTLPAFAAERQLLQLTISYPQGDQQQTRAGCQQMGQTDGRPAVT